MKRDWRISTRLWKQRPFAFDYSKGKYAVTNVHKGKMFHGVNVTTRYFKTKLQAVKYKKLCDIRNRRQK